MTWNDAEKCVDLVVAGPALPVPRSAPLFSYPLDFLATVLALEDGVLLHATAAVIDERAHVFVGASGVGKSTVAHKLAPCSAVLSDERVLVRQSVHGYRAWGTPWASSQGAARNESAPLAALYVMEQSKKDRISRLSPDALRDTLVRCTSIPTFHPPAMDRHLSALTRLSRSVPGFHFALTLDCPILEMVRGSL